MGGGSWTTDTYAARNLAAAAAGRSTFDYGDTMTRSMPSSSWEVHATLDPKLTNNDGDHAGQNIREALDSTEHPRSTPIAVFFDVTASMQKIPEVLQAKLPELHGLLQRKGYVEDPQILFGGIGDAYSDRIPLQVGQFESDNTMDQNLGDLVLEKGGGGGNHESYELAAYFMARHTYLDSFEKRGEKGYLFIVGDERIYDKISRRQVEELIGDTGLQEDIPTEQLFEELKEKFHVFFLFASQGSYRPEEVIPEDAATDPARGWGEEWSRSGGAIGWRGLLGQNAIELENADAVCETIALAIGMQEGAVTYEDGLEDLKEVSGDLASVNAAGKALATVGANATALATATGDLPGLGDGGDSDAGVETL